MCLNDNNLLLLRQMEGFGNGASLWELCEGNLEGGTFTGGPEEYIKKVQETGISLHRGTAGEPGGGLIYWGL